MSSLKGAGIQKGAVGANSSSPTTSPSVLLSNAAVADTTVVVNVPVEVKSLKQAEALGITAAYDTAKDVVLHRHIVDFYDMAGEGTSLTIILVDAPTPADALEDAAVAFAKKAIVFGAGKIRNVALSWNIPIATAETTTDGISTPIRAALPKAQVLADWAFATDRPVHILIEGRRLADAVNTAIDLRNIVVGAARLDAPNVSVVIGQDWTYAEARKTATANTKTQYYAAVGKALGTLAAAEMNQSIAEVASFNLSNAAKGFFVVGGLSNHKKISEVEADLQTLNDKGYIFPISYNTEAVSGLRWNGDHTCVEIRVDADGNINDHMIFYARTLNEVSRSLRNVLLQSVKRRMPANTSTGKLTSGSVKLLEADGNKVFELYQQAGFISGGRTIVDANSDLVTPPKTLFADFEVVPTLILDNIAGTVRLKKSFTV